MLDEAGGGGHLPPLYPLGCLWFDRIWEQKLFTDSNNAGLGSLVFKYLFAQVGSSQCQWGRGGGVQTRLHQNSATVTCFSNGARKFIENPSNASMWRIFLLDLATINRALYSIIFQLVRFGTLWSRRNVEMYKRICTCTGCLGCTLSFLYFHRWNPIFGTYCLWKSMSLPTPQLKIKGHTDDISHAQILTK